MPGPLATAEAVLGAPLTGASVASGLGIDPAVFKAIRQRASQRRAREDAKDKARGLSLPSKIAKSLGGAYAGPIGMVEPWLDGDSPGFEAARGSGFGGVYGQAGSEASARAAMLRGRSQPGYVRSTAAVGGQVPISGAGRGLIGESGGVSPLGAGRLALETALASLGLTMASPVEYAAGAAGSTAGREYARARRPENQRAQMYAGLAGSVAGGIGGDALTPEGWSPVGGMTALDRVVNAPGSWIRPEGTGTLATIGRAGVGGLPSTGSLTGDLLSRLTALRNRRTQELLARAYNPLPSVPGTMPVIQNPYA